MKKKTLSISLDNELYKLLINQNSKEQILEEKRVPMSKTISSILSDFFKQQKD